MSVSANLFGWIVELLEPPVRNESLCIWAPEFLGLIKKFERYGHPRPFREHNRIQSFSGGSCCWRAQRNDVINCCLLEAAKGQQIRHSCEGMRGRPFSSSLGGVDATSAFHAQQRRESVAQTSSGPSLDRCSRTAVILREVFVVFLAGGQVR